jgi:glycosyltransferase involved in cell wall biosynthesis
MTLHDHKLICPNYSMFDGRAFCYRCRGRRFHQAAIARCNEGSFPRSLLLTVEAYWQKWSRVYDGIRYFITPSRYLRDTFLAEGFAPDRVVYVAPFVARDSWGARAAPGGATAASAPVRSLPERYVLYFGRIGPEKGLLTLLEAVCQLRGVSLVVCGEGPLRERLEARAARGGGAEIVFTGFLGRAALDGVIRRSSVVVLPSISPENAPYTVLEAMALGRPVIVSNLGGLPELAGSGGGLIFEAGSANSLASRIREVWEDEELASSLGRKGAQFVEDRLTEDRHLDEIESLYRMAVA